MRVRVLGDGFADQSPPSVPRVSLRPMPAAENALFAMRGRVERMYTQLADDPLVANAMREIYVRHVPDVRADEVAISDFPYGPLLEAERMLAVAIRRPPPHAAAAPPPSPTQQQTQLAESIGRRQHMLVVASLE